MNNSFTMGKARKEQPSNNCKALLALASLAFIFILLSVSSASAQLGFGNSNLPNLKAPVSPGVQINNNTLNVNNSQFWQGYTPDSYNATYLAGRFAASLFYTNTVVNGNTSAIVAGVLNNFTAINANVSASYVPYVGASGNVDLGTNDVHLNSAFFDGNIQSIGNGTNFGIQQRGSYVFGDINVTGINSAAYVQNTTKGAFNHIRLTVSANNSTAIIYNPSMESLYPAYVLANGIVGGTNSSLRIGSISPGVFVGGYAASNTNQTNSLGMFTLVSGQGSFIYGRVAGATNQNGNLIGEAPGVFVTGYASGGTIQAGNSPAHGGAFAQGYASGVNSTVASKATAAFVQGRAGAANSQLLSLGAGAFTHGYIEGINSSIIASGTGSFVQGYILSPNNNITASGTASIAIGLPNMTCSATGSICLGQNVMVSGANSMAIGLGSTSLQSISSQRVLAIMTGSVGLNITNPQALLHVNGTSRFENNATFILNATTNNFFVGQHANSTGSPGLSQTITIVNSTLQNCTITFSQGLAMRTTC